MPNNRFEKFYHTKNRPNIRSSSEAVLHPFTDTNKLKNPPSKNEIPHSILKIEARKSVPDARKDSYFLKKTHKVMDTPENEYGLPVKQVNNVNKLI